jgi:phage major capsid protein E
MANIINAVNIVPEFREADLRFVVNNNPLGDLQYRGYFPLKFNTTLNWASIEKNTDNKVAAEIVAIGSKAPRKGRDFVEKVKGEIPKIEVARDMTERDTIRLDTIRAISNRYAGNTSAYQELLRSIYEDPIFCVNGVNSRLELLAKQLTSEGEYTLVAGAKIKFGVETKSTDKDWFNPSNASTFDPIKDFRSVQEEAVKKGFRYAYAIMDRPTFFQMVKSVSVVKFVASFAQNALNVAQEPTLAQLNETLKAHGLPEVIIWESYVSEEAKSGVKTTTSGWKLGNIHFTDNLQIGETYYTVTPSFDRKDEVTTKVISDSFILVSTWAEQDPEMLSTKATAFATPVLNNVSRKLILKTKLS